MKKLYLVLSAISVISVSAFAQRASAPKVVNGGFPTSTNPTIMTPTDTIWGNFPFGSNTTGTATPKLYSSSGGGFVAGNNSYGDKNKVQAFTVTSAYTVEGAIVWFGAKKITSTSATSKVVLQVYKMDGVGAISTNTVSGTTPKTVVASTNTDILISAIDTTVAGNGGFVFCTFPSSYIASANYAVGIDLTTLAAGDTLGMVTTDTTQSVAKDMSFDKWSDNTWHSFLEPGNWSLDLDIAIFPIININTGIQENFINGIKLYENYPNPFSSSTTIAYELESNAKNVTFFIHDLNGKQVKKIELGNVASGKHMLDLSASELSSGTYFVMMQADHNRLAEKMTIAK